MKSHTNATSTIKGKLGKKLWISTCEFTPKKAASVQLMGCEDQFKKQITTTYANSKAVIKDRVKGIQKELKYYLQKRNHVKLWIWELRVALQ